VTTGTPIEAGGLLCEYKNTARVAAESLKETWIRFDQAGYDRNPVSSCMTGHIIQGLPLNIGFGPADLI